MPQNGCKKLDRMVAMQKNGTGKAWALVWIPYHDIVDRVTYISFLANYPQYKDPNNNYQALTWNNRRELFSI